MTVRGTMGSLRNLFRGVIKIAPPLRSQAGKSFHPHQKSTGFDLSIFYPLRKQWYIITRKRASHHRRCISSAAGCISFRNDDIQNFVLMICNSCGIDDIHGFRRDLCEGSNSYVNCRKYLFRSPCQNKKTPNGVFLFCYE